MKSKICAKCKKRKRISSFNKSKRGKLGLSGYCRPCDAENKRQWYLRNKEHVLQKAQEWYEQNPERYAKNQKNHKQRYKEHYSEYHKKWAIENPDKCRLKKHRYYARRKRQLGEVSPNIIDRLFGDQKGLCFYCSGELQDYHLEHMIPISRNGLHDDGNLCLSCPTCNLRKKDKTAEEFKQMQEETTHGS
jgi:hypothetical protein